MHLPGFPRVRCSSQPSKFRGVVAPQPRVIRAPCTADTVVVILISAMAGAGIKTFADHCLAVDKKVDDLMRKVAHIEKVSEDIKLMVQLDAVYSSDPQPATSPVVSVSVRHAASDA